MMDTYQLKRPETLIPCWNCCGAGKFRGSGMLIQDCHACDAKGWVEKHIVKAEDQRIEDGNAKKSRKTDKV